MRSYSAYVCYVLWGKPLGAAAVLGVLLGVWVAWCLNSYYSEQRREKEYKSLLVSFAHELVEAFHRCVLYYKQQQKQIVSFSALFDFNDASTVSRLASVTDKPEIVNAIMYLKTQYFQVSRHVVHASALAAEHERLAAEYKIRQVEGSEREAESGQGEHREDEQRIEDELRKLWVGAVQAQSRALAFFLGDPSDRVTYPKIVNSTNLLIRELKENWPSRVADELETKFVKAKRRKAKIDCIKKRRELQNADQNVDQNVDQARNRG